MGRLEIQVRHGHSGGPAQWGGVVALIVLALFAASGHHEIAAMLHEVLAVAEIAAASAVGLGVLALAVLIAVRARRARRRARYADRRAAAAAARHYALHAFGARAALDQVRPGYEVPGYLSGDVAGDEDCYPF